MSELQLIGAPASNFVWVTRIACNEKGVPYQLVPAMPHTPEVDALHPLGKIPVMRHGDVALCESRAICYYIDQAFAGPPLVPREPAAAARVEQWLSLVNTSVDPLLLRTYLRAYIFPNTADGSPERPTIEAALPKMQQHFQMLDAAVAASGYLAGNSFTLADMNLLPILYYMKKMPESRAMLAQAAYLTAYFERHVARPSIQRAIPESMPPQFVRAFEAAEAA